MGRNVIPQVAGFGGVGGLQLLAQGFDGRDERIDLLLLAKNRAVQFVDLVFRVGDLDFEFGEAGIHDVFSGGAVGEAALWRKASAAGRLAASILIWPLARRCGGGHNAPRRPPERVRATPDRIGESPMSRRAFALFALLAASLNGLAAELVCPDLATAVQVAPCPTDEELSYTYKGYCGDNNRLYGKEAEVCAEFENYRKLKNIALWESADGEFSGYVSCDLPAASLRAATAQSMKLAKQGGVTRLVCAYGGNLSFTHRTRAECSVQGSGACAGEGASCKATCR